jgi:hypothetical protein
MQNNFYKNHLNLINGRTANSFVCPMDWTNNRRNGFYKYYKKT